jgi:hypothetical protein
MKEKDSLAETLRTQRIIMLIRANNNIMTSLRPLRLCESYKY